MFTASPFKLSMFVQCPQKYKFAYIDKLAAEFRVPRPYFTMGENVHSALRDFLGYVPFEERTEERLHQLLRSYWKKNRKGFENTEEEKKWGEKALEMLSRFYQTQNWKLKPLAVEQNYEILVNPDLSLSGKIDRIDAEPDGAINIIDYKTGKEPADVQTLLQDDIQLLAYCYLAQKQLNRRVNSAACLYLQTGNFARIEPTKEMIEFGVNKICKLVSRIIMESEFSPKINPFCRLCDFVTICPKRAEIESSTAPVKEEELPF
ncbi:MAG: PD-(D/E)XK nuclease family protein [bacterium]|nr:PD-(D/E)XK nuclease family protein [bacterium]